MNKDGKVTLDDYYRYMKELNEEDNISYEDAKESFRDLDPDSDGVLDFNEFIDLAPELYYSGIKKGPREIHISLTNISGIM